MIHELTMIDAQDFPKIPGITNYGSHNDMPEPFKEITPDEFWHYFGIYGTGRFDEFKQVKFDDGQANMYRNIHILWYQSCGMAIMSPVHWRCRRPDDGEGYQIIYEDQPRFFRLGCDHDYFEYDREYANEHGLPYTSGRCYHNTVCTKCGHVGSYDSSD